MLIVSLSVFVSKCLKFSAVFEMPLFVLLFIPKLSYAFFSFSIFISRRNQLGGGTKPMACTLMMMPTVMHRVLARSVHIAHATAVFPRTCVRLRMWPKCLTAVPRPTGPRGKRGWWDYKLCWRTNVLSGTTHTYTHRVPKDCLEGVSSSAVVPRPCLVC